MEDFPKYERICKEIENQSLFSKGDGFSCYPYRVVFLPRPVGDKPVTCRLLLSVSKKRFHHAFKRNLVKRLIRESWRKNKTKLYEVCSRDTISMDVALIYNATVIHSYAEMFDRTAQAVNELINRYEKTLQTPH